LHERQTGHGLDLSAHRKIIGTKQQNRGPVRSPGDFRWPGRHEGRLEEGGEMAKLGSTQQGSLCSSKQRPELNRRGIVESLCSVDRSERSVPDSRKRFIAPDGLSSKRGSGWCTYSGLLPAYVRWKFLGQLCSRANLWDSPKRVLEELGEIRTVDVVLRTKVGKTIRTGCVTQPSSHQKILLNALGLELPKQVRNIKMR